MRTLDFHRGLTTLVAAGVAGLLIWIATQVGQQSTPRFWASMGIVAGAGLVMALSQLLGGWTKFGWPRLSLGVFLLGFLPVLILTGWILLATQPGSGWQEGRLVSWSHTLGVFGFVREIGLYHGVLAFGFGLVLGYCFDTGGLRRREERVVERRAGLVADEPTAAERTEIARSAPIEPTRRRTHVLSGSEGAVGDGRDVRIREIDRPA